jgi:hypothetical protein
MSFPAGPAVLRELRRRCAAGVRDRRCRSQHRARVPWRPITTRVDPGDRRGELADRSSVAVPREWRGVRALVHVPPEHGHRRVVLHHPHGGGLAAVSRRHLRASRRQRRALEQRVEHDGTFDGVDSARSLGVRADARIDRRHGLVRRFARRDAAHADGQRRHVAGRGVSQRTRPRRASWRSGPTRSRSARFRFRAISSASRRT